MTSCICCEEPMWPTFLTGKGDKRVETTCPRCLEPDHDHQAREYWHEEIKMWWPGPIAKELPELICVYRGYIDTNENQTILKQYKVTEE